MIEDVTSQLRRGVVEFCVLGLLDRAPMYGWQISSELTDRGLIASIGTLYPLLTRLRDRSFIEAFVHHNTDDTVSSGPPRKYYRLTKSGDAHLAQFRKQWGPFTANVTALVGEELP